MSKRLAGFYNDSDIDIKLVKYDDPNSTSPISQDTVPKGTCFTPPQQYNVPDCWPVNDHFQTNHIEIQSADNQDEVWLCFWDEDNPDDASYLYYCIGKSASDVSLQMPGSFYGNNANVYFVFSGSKGEYQINAYQGEPSLNSYVFDVVFKSDAKPATGTCDANNPIGMAFGYSFVPLSDSTQKSNASLEIGERTKQQILQNSHISFRLYDLADPSTQKTIKEVVVSFKDEQDGLADPFGWSGSGSQMTFTIDQIAIDKTNTSSLGCNIACTTGYGIGGQSLGYVAQKPGTYELTVTVTMSDGTVFQADPEVDIEGVG